MVKGFVVKNTCQKDMHWLQHGLVLAYIGVLDYLGSAGARGHRSMMDTRKVKSLINFALAGLISVWVTGA